MCKTIYSYLVTRTITRIGSFETVITYIDIGGPNAKRKHPKNSTKAIILQFFLCILYLNIKIKSIYSRNLLDILK